MKSTSKSVLYKNLCIALGIAVLVLGYYQFFGNAAPETESPKKINGYTPSAEQTTTGAITPKPLPTPLPILPPVTPPKSDEPSSSTGSSLSGSTIEPATASGADISTDIVYSNEAVGYSFNMPRNSYFAGFGAQDGAAHTVGITTGTGAESFSGSSVRVWYYPKTQLAELAKSESGFYQDPSINMTYLKLGSGSLRIEGNMESPIVNRIIATVKRTK